MRLTCYYGYIGVLLGSKEPNLIESLSKIMYIFFRKVYIVILICLFMDKRSRFSKIKKVIERISSKDTIHLNDLRKVIAEEVGMSDGVIRDSLRNLIDFGYIKEVEHLVFSINYDI